MKQKQGIVWMAAALLAFEGASAVAAPRAALQDLAGASVTLARGGGFRAGPVEGFRAGPAVGFRGGYYGGWRRPYAWAPGGAIAAGAAIGVMSAADAAAYATVAAPADGLCWFYTDDSATQGFWDSCQ